VPQFRDVDPCAAPWARLGASAAALTERVDSSQSSITLSCGKTDATSQQPHQWGQLRTSAGSAWALVQPEYPSDPGWFTHQGSALAHQFEKVVWSLPKIELGRGSSIGDLSGT
jgi:hypothetical protein